MTKTARRNIDRVKKRSNVTCLARSSRSILPKAKKGESGLKRRRIAFQYGNSDSESDSDSEAEQREEQSRATAASRMLSIDIDLGLTPWANASQYYDQKKQASEKQQRTVQSSTKALKSHEKKVTADLKKNLKQEKQVLRQAREPFWFEKFVFFVSSEGYLVLG